MRKKFFIIILSVSLVAVSGIDGKTLASTLDTKPSYSNEVGTFAVVNPGDGFTWQLYYTDYSLNDGWYEKWFKYEDGAGIHRMVKTYNSNGSLMKTRYY